METAELPKVRAAVPVLVTVTIWVAALDQISVSGKFGLLAEKVGLVTASVPIPTRRTLYGPDMSLVKSRNAIRDINPLGLKTIPTVQLSST